MIFGPAERASAIRVNGQTGLGIGIIRQAQSNTLDISEGVRAAVDELNASLPTGVDIRVTSDDATFIGGALEKVLTTLGEATLIVVAVIFLFLRSLRATIIPAVTVPIALIGTIAAIYLAGFSLNILTLLAIVLATGLVVDDAIVVLENIERHRAQGMGPRAAAVLGARQVFFAVVSTTATLAAVFIPISFLPGTAGRLFAEFGFVMAFAVAISMVVALTLCPMLASRILKEHAGEAETIRNPLLRAAERARRRRRAALPPHPGDGARRADGRRRASRSLFAGAAAVTYTLLPEQLTPTEDRGVVLDLRLEPAGRRRRLSRHAHAPDRGGGAAAAATSGEATNIFLIAGMCNPNSGFVVLTLAPWAERARSQQEITRELNGKLQQIPGMQVFARQANSLGIRGGGQGLRFAITGKDYDALAVEAEKLQHSAGRPSGLRPACRSTTTPRSRSWPSPSTARRRPISASPSTSLGTTLATLLDGRDDRRVLRRRRCDHRARGGARRHDRRSERP